MNKIILISIFVLCLASLANTQEIIIESEYDSKAFWITFAIYNAARVTDACLTWKHAGGEKYKHLERVPLTRCFLDNKKEWIAYNVLCIGISDIIAIKCRKRKWAPIIMATMGGVYIGCAVCKW